MILWIADKLGCFTYPDTFPVDGNTRDKWGLLHHKKAESCRSCQRKTDHAGIKYDKNGNYMRRVKEGGRLEWVTDPVQWDPTKPYSKQGPVTVYPGPGDMGWGTPPPIPQGVQQMQVASQRSSGPNHQHEAVEDHDEEGDTDIEEEEEEDRRRARPQHRNRPQHSHPRGRTAEGRSGRARSSMGSSATSPRAVSVGPSTDPSRLPSTLPPSYTSRLPGQSTLMAGNRRSRRMDTSHDRARMQA